MTYPTVSLVSFPQMTFHFNVSAANKLTVNKKSVPLQSNTVMLNQKATMSGKIHKNTSKTINQIDWT